jgi:hypothetical protein
MKQKLSQKAMHAHVSRHPTSSVDKAESSALWLRLEANLSSSSRQFLTLEPNSEAINVEQEEMEDEIFCF